MNQADPGAIHGRAIQRMPCAATESQMESSVGRGPVTAAREVRVGRDNQALPQRLDRAFESRQPGGFDPVVVGK